MCSGCFWGNWTKIETNVLYCCFFFFTFLSKNKLALSSYNDTASNKLAALHGYHSLCCVVACVFGWGEGGGKAASLPFDSSAGNSVICRDA